MAKKAEKKQDEDTTSPDVELGVVIAQPDLLIDVEGTLRAQRGHKGEMSFETALVELKAGHLVSRRKNVFLKAIDKSIWEFVNGTAHMWRPSGPDVMAEDWYLVA